MQLLIGSDMTDDDISYKLGGQKSAYGWHTTKHKNPLLEALSRNIHCKFGFKYRYKNAILCHFRIVNYHNMFESSKLMIEIAK